jgi:hypothetical protein
MRESTPLLQFPVAGEGCVPPNIQLGESATTTATRTAYILRSSLASTKHAHQLHPLRSASYIAEIKYSGQQSPGC